MPSLVELVESHLLRNLTDPDTYDAGVELADRGAVEFDELGPLRARARVEDGGTFVADLKSGPGKLIWSCTEPGGSRGSLCRHCVAAAVDIWRRTPARHAGAGSLVDDQADQPLRLAQPHAAEQAATLVAAGRPAVLTIPVEEDGPVTSEPAPTTQTETVTTLAHPEGESPAPPNQPDQSASPVLMRSIPPEPAPPPIAGSTPRSAPVPDATRGPDGLGITGVHAVIFTRAVAEVRAFFRDALGLPNVDAGDGWLIFALPPAELAVHPADMPSQEIYLMCDDIEATLTGLERKGVAVRRPAREEAWGFVTEVALPGGTDLAIYQPKHPRPLATPPEPRS